MKLVQHIHILLLLVAIMVVLQLAKISDAKDPYISITASIKPIVTTDLPLEEPAPAAIYNESENSWSLSGQVREIKEVSIYRRPGSIARIRYLHKGEVRDLWAALTIDDYSFSGGVSDITVGDQITLRVSGGYVSSKGVDWSRCPGSDEFCRHAGFIEGGFPVSPDMAGLTMSPSNILIRTGRVSSDWINGMLAWKILLSED